MTEQKLDLFAASLVTEPRHSDGGAFGGRVARWGDYTAAVADADGSIWIATEYIPNAPRTLLANWGTFIGRVPR